MTADALAGPLLLTLQLAAVTTLILLVVATPLAWWLATTCSRWRVALQTVVALPIVLPPTVIGFYLLILLGPAGPVGRWWVAVSGEALTFSFAGLVIASCVYSLPFAVQPLMTSFSALDRRLLEAARTLGAGSLDAFRSVVMPLCRHGFAGAAILSFAHTLGEFGVVLMVGGNIPERTRVMSIAIYDRVEALDYATAHRLSLTMLAIAAAILLLAFVAQHRAERRR